MTEQQPGEVLGYSLGEALAAAAAGFVQIPLDANAPLIPYTDLRAQGAYGRGLILPDDIYPVLNHMALTGSKNGAKLATGANVDGAQDVYVVNQSGGGGGGGGAPSAYGTGYEINPIGATAASSNGADKGLLEYQTGSYFGFLFNWFFNAAPGGGTAKVQFYLQSKSIQDLQVALLSVRYPGTTVAGLTYPGAYTIYVPLNPPLDMRKTFAADPEDIHMYQDSNGCSFAGDWVGYSSGGT